MQDTITALYGVKEQDFLADTRWYDEKAKKHQDRKMVARMVRAMAQGDSFVFSVGGMSDTAGHGNRHSDSYPIVMFTALAPVFSAANIQLEVRNLAMGGVPSFPNSVCMEDAMGADSDVIVWDFRMVERDEVKGELYIRQVSSTIRAAVERGAGRGPGALRVTAHGAPFLKAASSKLPLPLAARRGSVPYR